jgi:hypothetical protein
VNTDRVPSEGVGGLGLPRPAAQQCRAIVFWLSSLSPHTLENSAPCRIPGPQSPESMARIAVADGAAGTAAGDVFRAECAAVDTAGPAATAECAFVGADSGTTTAARAASLANTVLFWANTLALEMHVVLLKLTFSAPEFVNSPWGQAIDLGSCGDGEQQRERQSARTLSGLGRKHVLCYRLRSLPRMQAPCFMPMDMCALFALPHRHDSGIRKACALHPFELNPHQSQSRSLTIGGIWLATHSHNRAVV